MPGLRSNHELRKWDLIQRAASVPLDKINRGTATSEDFATLGDTIAAYDDLAFSIFSEGMKLVESSARGRVEGIQEKRTLVKKAPLSAKQLSLIYAQAVDHANKETMPTILSSIRDMLAVQPLTNQPTPAAKPKLRVVGASDLDAEAPKEDQLQRNSIRRFIPSEASNDELATLQEAAVEQRQTLEELTKGIKNSLDAVNRLVDSDERRKKREEEDEKILKEIQAATKGGELTQDATTSQLSYSYTSAKGYQHVVTAPDMERIRAQVLKRDESDAKRDEEWKRRKEERLARNKSHGALGLLGFKTSEGVARHKRAQELVKARREAQVRKGLRKEGKMDFARRMVRNTKDEYGALTDFLKEKYSKVRNVGAKAAKIGMGILALLALPKILQSMWKGFTESFDVKSFLEDITKTTLSSVWDKVKALVGLEKEPLVGAKISYVDRSLKYADTMGGTEGARTKVREDIKKAVLADLADPKGTKYKASSAQAVKEKLGVEIPADRILTPEEEAAIAGVDTSGTGAAPITTGVATPSSPSSSGGSASPSSGGSGEGSSSGAPTPSVPAPDVSKPSASAANAPVASGGAPAAAPASNSSAGGGGLSANTDIPLATPAAAATPPKDDKPVTAKPPEPQASVAPAQSGSTSGGGIKAGSSPRNLASIPNSHLNSEAGFITNTHRV